MARRRIGFWYRLAAVICKPPLVVLFNRRWRGMEHIPAEGGFITVVNHNSYLDSLAYAHFQYNTGRVPRFLAKEALFRTPFVGMVLRGTRQIPVYRETTDASNSCRAAVEAVNSGECVTFYPEGTLTRDPDQWPMTGKTGAARTALLTRAPVIPVAQWGANEVMPPYAKRKRIRLFPRKTFRVQAGPPIDLSRWHDAELNAETLRAATDAIMDTLTELVAEVRGEPVPSGSLAERRRLAAAEARKQIIGESERHQLAADELAAGPVPEPAPPGDERTAADETIPEGGEKQE